jgi:transcriptional regulator with XRE-family HTH domain
MYNPIIVNSAVVRPLIGRVRSTFIWSQKQLGEALGLSKRTVMRWEGGQSGPADFQVAKMARLVYPRDKELARELAAAMGKSLVDLDIEAPPRPRPDAKAHLVDSIVCVAAEAASILPQAMRPALHAAFDRAMALELSAADVVEALKPASKTKREK